MGANVKKEVPNTRKSEFVPCYIHFVGALPQKYSGVTSIAQMKNKTILKTVIVLEKFVHLH